jgi:hypothetical protein
MDIFLNMQLSTKSDLAHLQNILTNSEISAITNTHNPFKGWHDDEYLKICMANLYEKHEKAKGKTQISQKEWQRVIEGYKTITGEYWKI